VLSLVVAVLPWTLVVVWAFHCVHCWVEHLPGTLSHRRRRRPRPQPLLTTTMATNGTCWTSLRFNAIPWSESRCSTISGPQGSYDGEKEEEIEEEQDEDHDKQDILFYSVYASGSLSNV
jgi:hypothetical protein